MNVEYERKSGEQKINEELGNTEEYWVKVVSKQIYKFYHLNCRLLLLDSFGDSSEPLRLISIFCLFYYFCLSNSPDNISVKWSRIGFFTRSLEAGLSDLRERLGKCKLPFFTSSGKNFAVFWSPTSDTKSATATTKREHMLKNTRLPKITTNRCFTIFSQARAILFRRWRHYLEVTTTLSVEWEEQHPISKRSPKKLHNLSIKAMTSFTGVPACQRPINPNSLTTS